MPKRRRQSRGDLTSQYLRGDLADDAPDTAQRFSRRSKRHQHNKIVKTARLRAEAAAQVADLEVLPVGRVIQVFSLYTAVEHQATTWLCVGRRTYERATGLTPIVGDLARFRETGGRTEEGLCEAVIEQILPRRTLLTRADSFKQVASHPIVANADRMLIVAALCQPSIKWGLIDRMLIAAQAGGLVPTLCINKVDLDSGGRLAEVQEILAHYASMGIQSLQCSVMTGQGLEEARRLLSSGITVLAGHSGVGKSSLVRAIDPMLDIRVGAISGYTGKGIHTTTSARLYHTAAGGDVIDTPGVKLFGLWGITRENLDKFFPDIQAGTAPPWRVQSRQRILASLPVAP
jgi:ribosome biogenesis GTPase